VRHLPMNGEDIWGSGAPSGAATTPKGSGEDIWASVNL
jgi:hypothetical protein